MVHGDIKEAPEVFGNESFSAVVTNPPYMKTGEGKISQNVDLAMARHEVGATLHDVIKSAQRLLIFGGRFYMVYTIVRLADAICEMKTVGLEPKIIRFIQPRSDVGPNLFLIMAKKSAGTGLVAMPPLVIYDNDGDYTKEIKEIYFQNTP